MFGWFKRRRSEEGIVANSALVVHLGRGVTLELVLIPAGSFMMGDENGEDNEKPVHKVTITRSFYLGKYPVTRKQWKAVMGKCPVLREKFGASMSDDPSDGKRDNHPVTLVGRDECQDFLSKVNTKLGRHGGKFVLPTEAQWEYACRAGSTMRYCFGDDESQLGQYAWYKDNSGEEETHPVGEKRPNTWGLFDMHGNVWEWCKDGYRSDFYLNSPTNDPEWPAEAVRGVFRDGASDLPAGSCRSAYRGDWFRDRILRNLGFRVCRTLPD